MHVWCFLPWPITASTAFTHNVQNAVLQKTKGCHRIRAGNGLGWDTESLGLNKLYESHDNIFE